MCLKFLNKVAYTLSDFKATSINPGGGISVNLTGTLSWLAEEKLYVTLTPTRCHIPQNYRNIHVLVTEIFRSYKGIFPKFMMEIFLKSRPLNYKTHQPNFSIRSFESVHYCTESLGYLRSKIWDFFPAHLKKAGSSKALSSDIKKNLSQRSVLADSLRDAFTKWTS